jgi:hypothetical protein
VNCWDSLKPSHHNVAGNGKRDGLKSERISKSKWEISSQVTKQLVEGSTTRAWSLSETVKPHERAATLRVEDIVWASAKAEDGSLKGLAGNNPATVSKHETFSKYVKSQGLGRSLFSSSEERPTPSLSSSPG